MAPDCCIIDLAIVDEYTAVVGSDEPQVWIYNLSDLSKRYTLDVYAEESPGPFNPKCVSI